MNVAIVNQWFPPASIGGVAQYNEYVAQGLTRAGHTVVVVCASDDGFPQYEVTNGIHIHRVKIQRIPGMISRLPLVGPHYRFLRNLLYSRSICNFLRRIIGDHRIDVVEYADINGEGFFHRKYLGHLPYIVRCHTPYYLLAQTYEPGEMRFSCRFLNWMEKKTIQRANGVTAPSHDLAERIQRWCEFPTGTVVPIPNPVDTDWFAPDPCHKPSQVTKVLFVGRIEKAKGIYVLADAIPEVMTKLVKVRFVFVGEPRNQKGLNDFETYLVKLGVRDYCDFMGGVTRERLRELYQQCDIFVNPSTIYESFSYTNAEAMACGKPVVTSDIGGMPETVGHMVGGLVFPNRASGDLARELIQLTKDEALRRTLGRKARERSLRYSVQTVADRTINVYRSARPS